MSYRNLPFLPARESKPLNEVISQMATARISLVGDEQKIQYQTQAFFVTDVLFDEGTTAAVGVEYERICKRSEGWSNHGN